MFHTLRKIVIVLFFLICSGAAVGVGAVVYAKRAVFDPIMVYLEVRKLPKAPGALEEISGQVVKTMNDYSLQLKDDRRLLSNFRLVGLAPLDQKRMTNETELVLQDGIETRFRQLVLSNQVRVRVSYLNAQRTGLGLVYTGTTNVNVTLVQEGLAKVKREFLHGLPRIEQYALVRAEHKARERKLGLWKEGENSPNP